MIRTSIIHYVPGSSPELLDPSVDGVAAFEKGDAFTFEKEIDPRVGRRLQRLDESELLEHQDVQSFLAEIEEGHSLVIETLRKIGRPPVNSAVDVRSFTDRRDNERYMIRSRLFTSPKPQRGVSYNALSDVCRVLLSTK